MAMFVDVEKMRAGANASYSASWLAMEGKHRLSGANLGNEIFGNFAAADAFQSAVSGTHAQHVSRLHRHETQLGDLGDHAHVAASSFDAMEKRNTEALESIL